LNNKSNKVVVAEGSGSWLEYIEYDNEVYWTVEDEKPVYLMPDDESLNPEFREFILPSDSSNRIDKKLIGEKKFEEAEKEKAIIEDL